MTIKNLIIQYGQCENSCPNCYLKRFNVTKNNQKFDKTLEYLRPYTIDNLCISIQNLKYLAFYRTILNFLCYERATLTINYKDYMEIIDNPGAGRYFNNIGKDFTIFISINSLKELIPALLWNEIFKFSFYLNNNRFNELEEVLEFLKRTCRINRSIYVTIEKFEEINWLKLFDLYTRYPEFLDLDSCYKRVVGKDKCNDVFVLNEDGNIYTCPYNADFMDNELTNKERECPYIKLKG